MCGEAGAGSHGSPDYTHGSGSLFDGFENGAGRITDVFPIHILVVDFLSCGVVLNMVPNSHKFALRKGATLTI